MSRKKVLIGSPVNQEPEILKEFASSLLNLNLEGIKASFLFMDDNWSQESGWILKELCHELKGNIIEMEEKSANYRAGNKHAWNGSNLLKVGAMRNSLLNEARGKDYDALFLIDSDLLLHPKTLMHLMRQEKDIISEIYWTSWSPGSPQFPQVWLYDNYTQFESAFGEGLDAQKIREKIQAFHNMLRVPGVYRVGGLGGCTLIGKKVLSSSVSYDRIPNLSFMGEDRHFCVRAAVAGFEMYVDTHYPAYHIYRSSDLSGAEMFKAQSGYRENTPGF